MVRSWSFLAPAPVVEVEQSDSPTFSVIIAAYNASAYLPEAIESCLAQTLQPLEIVVVDDGSTDDFDAAIEPYLDRVLLLRQANRGESAAKNAAVRAASGEYVVILDADDIAYPDRIEALYAFAVERPDLAILTHDDVLTRDGEFLRNYFGELHAFPISKQREEILRWCFIVNPAVRRSTWLECGGYDENLRIGADWELWIRIIFSGGAVGAIAEPLVEYRHWGGNLTADLLGSFASRLELLSKTQLRSDLTATERAALEQSLLKVKRRFALQALHVRDPSAKSAMKDIFLDRRQSVKSRARAAAAFVMPNAARKRLSADE